MIDLKQIIAVFRAVYNDGTITQRQYDYYTRYIYGLLFLGVITEDEKNEMFQKLLFKIKEYIKLTEEK